jgi:DNA-binding XRE family transcriptional regulator
LISEPLVRVGMLLRAERTSRGLNQTAFGELGGVSLTTQQQYEAGKTSPTVEYLLKLQEHGFDPRVLFGDAAPPIGSIAAMLTPDQLTFLKGGLPRSAIDQLRRIGTFSSQYADGGETPDLVAIGEIDLAYGLGGTFSDGPVEMQTLHFSRSFLESITSTPPSQLTFARGRGDSMQPTLLDDDVVLIDRSARTVREQDAIWALTIGDIAMIKRLRVRGEQVQILSDNDRVPTDEAHHEEVNIVGRVIFIGRKL